LERNPHLNTELHTAYLIYRRFWDRHTLGSCERRVTKLLSSSRLLHTIAEMNRFRTQITQVPANQHNLRLFTKGSNCNRLFAFICAIRVIGVLTNLLLWCAAGAGLLTTSVRKIFHSMRF